MSSCLLKPNTVGYMLLWNGQKLWPFLLTCEIFPPLHRHRITVTSLRTRQLRKPDQPEPNLPALGCRPARFFCLFLGCSQPAGQCQPHWVLGELCFHGPSALFNGLRKAGGWGTVLTLPGWYCRCSTLTGHLAKNICIERCTLKRKPPPSGRLF